MKRIAGGVLGFTHHIKEDVEAVRAGRVGGDDQDDGDRVDGTRLGHDPGFPRETERLARVAHRALAGPEAISDEHCGMARVSDERGARELIV